MVKNSTCFGTDFLSIFRSLYTVFIAIRICHTSYVDCLQTLNITSMTNTYCCEYSIKNPDDGQNICPKHVEFFTKIKFRNCASCWLLLLKCIIKGINIYNRQKVPRNFWIWVRIDAGSYRRSTKKSATLLRKSKRENLKIVPLRKQYHIKTSGEESVKHSAFLPAVIMRCELQLSYCNCFSTCGMSLGYYEFQRSCHCGS